MEAHQEPRVSNAQARAAMPAVRDKMARDFNMSVVSMDLVTEGKGDSSWSVRAVMDIAGSDLDVLNSSDIHVELEDGTPVSVQFCLVP